jgi:hypothetical protein
MRPNSITPELLVSVNQVAFRRVLAELPSEIASRLRPVRKPWRHETRNSVIISALRDVHEFSAVIEPCYMQYEHVFDPEHAYSDGTDWYMGFHINPNRLYQNPKEIIARLERDLPRNCPDEFTWRRLPNWIGVMHHFDFAGSLDRLPDYIVPRYVRLIKAAHPILMDIIDAFRAEWSLEERAAVIAGRAPARARNVAPHPRAAELSRNIPPALREEVLALYKHRCACCGASGIPLEVDHAVPVSQGGLTRLDNLQPLCAVCHLRKGTKIIHFQPKP